jgi:hypothetical protein
MTSIVSNMGFVAPLQTHVLKMKVPSSGTDPDADSGVAGPVNVISWFDEPEDTHLHK